MLQLPHHTHCIVDFALHGDASLLTTRGQTRAGVLKAGIRFGYVGAPADVLARMAQLNTARFAALVHHWAKRCTQRRCNAAVDILVATALGHFGHQIGSLPEFELGVNAGNFERGYGVAVLRIACT